MAFTVMLSLFLPNINSGVYPILYFAIMGVQTQLSEIRISLGGSALFAGDETRSVSLGAKQHIQTTE